jgi:hypothetical protein
MSSPEFEDYLKRVEEEVDLRDDNLSYNEFARIVVFRSGRRWTDSTAQVEALKNGAEKRGYDLTLPYYVKKKDYLEYRLLHDKLKHIDQTWRFETVKVRGKGQVRYRDLKTGRFIKKPQ